jgi:hypothetical protein
MTELEKFITRTLLAILFTLLNWLVISHYIVEISLLRYFFVELILVISYKFYTFTISKYNLQ